MKQLIPRQTPINPEEPKPKLVSKRKRPIPGFIPSETIINRKPEPGN